MAFCERVLIFDFPFEGRFSWRKFLDMVDVLVHVEPNRLKMDPEDNCMVLSHSLHWSVTLLKQRVPHRCRAAFASTDPTFQPNAP